MLGIIRVGLLDVKNIPKNNDASVSPPLSTNWNYFQNSSKIVKFLRDSLWFLNSWCWLISLGIYPYYIVYITNVFEQVYFIHSSMLKKKIKIQVLCIFIEQTTSRYRRKFLLELNKAPPRTPIWWIMRHYSINNAVYIPGVIWKNPR